MTATADVRPPYVDRGVIKSLLVELLVRDISFTASMDHTFETAHISALNADAEKLAALMPGIFTVRFDEGTARVDQWIRWWEDNDE